MLALALVPSVSRALDAGGPASPWSQICSTPGNDGAPALPGSLAHAEHCPLCGHGAGPLGLPPATVAVLAVPVQRAFVAPQPGVAAVSADGWRAAQPRAPPAFS